MVYQGFQRTMYLNYRTWHDFETIPFLLQWAVKPLNGTWTLLSETTGNFPISDRPYYILGRNPDMGVDIVVDDTSVSQRHAALVHHRDGRLFVIDLASRTGVILNGERIPANKPKVISHGSILGIGPYEYRLNSGDHEVKPEKVCASHLLVKHAQSRRPSSWKEATITRSPQEALQMIERYREMIVNNECDFRDLASTQSDCGSAKRQGDLGWFGPGEMQKEFEDAAFALQVNELSGPVHSQSGIHLILRTG